jgi:hypothetical protein
MDQIIELVPPVGGGIGAAAAGEDIHAVVGY